MTTKNRTYNISVQKTYNESAETIFNLFMDGTVFKMTGADNIECDFKAGGQFRLMFNQRGVIYGQFIQLMKNNIVIEWKVEGFQKPSEIHTLVEINLSENNSACILTIRHKNIIHKDSASAKQKAWTEILDDIERKVNNRL